MPDTMKNADLATDSDRGGGGRHGTTRDGGGRHQPAATTSGEDAVGEDRGGEDRGGEDRGGEDRMDAEGRDADDRSGAVASHLARLVRTLWFAIGITLALLLLAWAGPTILLIFAGLLFGTVLHGLAALITGKTPLPYAWALLLICVAVAAGLGLTGIWLGPQVADQLAQLGDELRSSWDSLMERLRGVEGFAGLVRDLGPEKLAEQIRATAGPLMSLASGILAAVGGVVVVAFIGVYTAASPGDYTAGPLWLTAPERRDHVRDLFQAVAKTLQWWFAARLMSMAVVGVLTGIGLWLIGMPLFAALGMLAALLSFIPYLGPVLAAVPAVLIGLAHSPTMALWVLLLYVGVQTVESYLVTPQLVQRAINLPAAAILMVQLLFGVFFGILGVAFASPISAAILTIIKKTVDRPEVGRSS